MKSANTKKNVLDCLEEIIKAVVNKNAQIDNRHLLEICSNFNIFGGKSDPHFCHEIAETALNLLIKREYAKKLLAAPNPAEVCGEVIRPFLKRLPTQTWRSGEQVRCQQFSTPPTIAYLVAYLMNFKTGEKILEPSAGTGSLAVWASGAELSLEIHTNEVDERRSVLLRTLGFAPTNYNAEFIHDYLPAEVEADCVMMNPPFSSSGGRTANNSCKFGFRHVESAFERLKRGGKFGVILGDVADPNAKVGNNFWKNIADRIILKAVIKLSGREYYKNGTSVGVNIFIGRKLIEPEKPDWNRLRKEIIVISAQTVERAFAAAESRNLRLNQ